MRMTPSVTEVDVTLFFSCFWPQKKEQTINNGNQSCSKVCLKLAPLNTKHGLITRTFN